MKTITVAETNYGQQEVNDLRDRVIELRDEALKQADFGWAVTLSHVVAYMCVSAGIIFGEDK